MKNKYLWLCFLSLFLLSGTLLVDRFIVPVPVWLAVINIIVAFCAFVTFLIISHRKNEPFADQQIGIRQGEKTWQKHYF